MEHGTALRHVAHVIDIWISWNIFWQFVFTARSCPDPQESRFQNGSIKGKAYFYPETIELRCISGHELVGGGPFFYCNDGGNWVPIEKLPNDTQNEIEQRRERERREAFECLGTREIVTKSPGTKLPTFPTCERENEWDLVQRGVPRLRSFVFQLRIAWSPK